MTPEQLRDLTLALMERDRETFLAQHPPGLDVRLLVILSEAFAAGFAFGASAGLEISAEVRRAARNEH